MQEAYEHTGSGDVRAYLFPHGIRKVPAVPSPALRDTKKSGDESGAVSAGDDTEDHKKEKKE